MRYTPRERPVSSQRLRWREGLASRGSFCSLVCAASFSSYEDFGLTPLEAATFGKPAAVLRWGGFLDTVAEGTTGVFFEEPTADAIARAIQELGRNSWDAEAIGTHADSFSEARFIERMRRIVADAGRAA